MQNLMTLSRVIRSPLVRTQSTLHLVVFCVIWSTAFGQDAVPDKYALLVGVTNYSKPELNTGLKFPEKDASDIAALLKASGFDVDLLIGKQATKAAIQAKLDTFAQRGKNDGVVFVGFCGHGTEFVDTKKSFFCPYDTAMKAVRDKQNNPMFNNDGTPMMGFVSSSMVAIDDVLIAFGESQAANRILVADCCRDDPNRARGRSFGSSLAPDKLPIQTLMLLGCSSQERSLEHDDWGHGALTKCLLDQMESTASGSRTMGSIAEDVIPAVKQLVASKNNGNDKQTPRMLSTGRVELLLRGREPKSGAIPKERSMADREPSGNKNGERNASPKDSRTAGKEEQVLLAQNVSLTLNWVPAGKAILGSPPTEIQRELGGKSEKQFEYTTRGFWLAKFECTREQWSSIMGGNVAGKNMPVGNISYQQMERFAQRLNEIPGVRQASENQLGKGSFVIPTEDQWEYACRGGLGNAHAFYWGPTANGREANLNGGFPYPDGTPRGPQLNKAVAVGSYASIAPHPWGLCDLHGNLWEFCKSRDTGGKAVIRGGSYFDQGIWQCRAAYRDYQDTTKPYGNMGFRVAYDVEE